MNLNIKCCHQLTRTNVKQYIDTYLVQEQEILDDSYFFFDFLPADIELIRVIDNIRCNGLKAYDETNDSDVDFNIDSRRFIKRPRRLRTGAWFLFYHDTYFLSSYQIFSFDQLFDERLSTGHCFVNCLKYFNIDMQCFRYSLQ
jgi:hypothetical protein